jgi:hypothetical protein
MIFNFGTFCRLLQDCFFSWGIFQTINLLRKDCRPKKKQAYQADSGRKYCDAKQE